MSTKERYTTIDIPSAATPEHILRSVDGSIFIARDHFREQLETLPRPFNTLAADHVSRRLDGAHERPTLGEYVPWLIGDAIRAGPDTTQAVTTPWLFLYHHIISLDDSIDSTTAPRPANLLLSSVLLERALSGFRGLFPQDERFWDGFQRYYEQAVVAEHHETNVYHDATRGFDDDEHLTMGRKSSVLKLCATALTLKTMDRPLTEHEDDAFDRIAAGFQLLDDLTDWEDDLQTRNFTYPLGSAAGWLRRLRGDVTNDTGDVTPDEMFVSLLMSGAVEKTLEHTSVFLRQGKERGLIAEATVMGRYIDAVIRRNDDVSLKMRQLLDNISEDEHRTFIQDIRRPGVATVPSTTVWQHLRSIFRVVAQGAS